MSMPLGNPHLNELQFKQRRGLFLVLLNDFIRNLKLNRHLFLKSSEIVLESVRAKNLRLKLKLEENSMKKTKIWSSFIWLKKVLVAFYLNCIHSICEHELINIGFKSCHFFNSPRFFCLSIPFLTKLTFHRQIFSQSNRHSLHLSLIFLVEYVKAFATRSNAHFSYLITSWE